MRVSVVCLCPATALSLRLLSLGYQPLHAVGGMLEPLGFLSCFTAF
jgi:hypothetical protein